MDCCALGQRRQSGSNQSGLDEGKQTASECIVKPSSLQSLPAIGSRVSSQKKQPPLPRRQAMVPGQSIGSAAVVSIDL